ncbi:MAG: DinB family protein [Acidobacteriaceae bacterium]
MKYLAICLCMGIFLAPTIHAQDHGTGTTAKAQHARASQAAPTVAQVADMQIAIFEKQFVPLVEAMPADKYSFAPTDAMIKGGNFKTVRTFAEQIKHVAGVNYRLWAASLGEKPPAAATQGENGPASMQSKAEILAYLKGSFEMGHRAAKALTKENMLDSISMGHGNAPRLFLVTYPVEHDFDHYGQLVEYLRMNGIVPPASR